MCTEGWTVAFRDCHKVLRKVVTQGLPSIQPRAPGVSMLGVMQNVTRCMKQFGSRVASLRVVSRACKAAALKLSG